MTDFHDMLLRVVPFDANEGLGELKNILGDGVFDPSTLQAREKKPFKMLKGVSAAIIEKKIEFSVASKFLAQIKIIG